MIFTIIIGRRTFFGIVNGTNYLNPPISYGIYPTWCVDEWNLIFATQGSVPGSTIFTGALYSTCDPLLNSYLQPLNHMNTVVSAATWQMVNYILNNHTYNGTNAFYWDEQAAINTLVGNGTGSINEYAGLLTTPLPDGYPYPTFHSNVVYALLAAATNYAPTWVPQCGDVYGVIYVTEPTTDQFLMLAVPIRLSVSIPLGSDLGCNPLSPPTDASVQATAVVNVPATVTVTHTTTTSTSDCLTTTVFTAIAKDTCNDQATATATYTWTEDTTPPTISGVPAGGDLGCNPNPTSLPTDGSITSKVSASDTCSAATIVVTHEDATSGCVTTRTFTIKATDACNNGKTYTYAVPDCDIVFANNCTAGSTSFDGTKWTTTLPTLGDDEIFLAGCAIPCNPDFANAHTVCWQGTFSCNVPGTTFNWQWGAACYNNNIPQYGSLGVKACHQTPCGYIRNSGDHAGTPENEKSSCVGGGTGGGGSSWTGSWSSTGSYSFQPCN